MTAQTQASGRRGLAAWGVVLGTLLIATATLATVAVTFAQATLN
jgi:hypothetical protein